LIRVYAIWWLEHYCSHADAATSLFVNVGKNNKFMALQIALFTNELMVRLVFAIVLPPTFLFSRLVFSAYFNLERGPQMDTFGDCFNMFFSDPILFLILLPHVAPGL